MASYYLICWVKSTIINLDSLDSNVIVLLWVYFNSRMESEIIRLNDDINLMKGLANGRVKIDVTVIRTTQLG